jgi:hypothetical protein
MAKEGIIRKQKWLSAVINLSAGAVGVLAAFGVLRGNGGGRGKGR